MDGTFKSITCRKGASLSINTTTYRCYAYQKINSASQRTGETKLTCRNCKKEFLVPSNITAYRCYACRGVVSKSISGYEQSREDSGAKLFKHEQMGNANTEEEHDPNLIPTKRNILESLKWLVKDCQSGDSLVFYFSGHGLQQPEYYKQDEIDGLDETICPVDFMKEGMITDNELNSTIVSPIKNGVTLHAILDACHSGTTLDLMYVYKQKNSIWNWEDNKPHSKEPISKHTSGGVVICFSACEDSQMAADTNVFGGKGMNGVMTYLFTKTIRERSGITYGDLLEKIHDQIGKIHQSKCCNSILKHIFHRKVKQDPLLSSTEIFDVSTTKFTL